MIEVRKYRLISRAFYARPAEIVARELLGHTLVRVLDDGTVLAGRIVETEAYLGEDDPACHSARGKTEVTRLFWGPPGFAYIYLCMGMWYCLNVVVEPEGRAGCVLFRALEPVAGIEQMRLRRVGARKDSDLCSGPGRLCQALDIDVRLNAADMTLGSLFVADAREDVPTVGVSPRIGISKATDWPLRFFIVDNAHVSRARPGVIRQQERKKMG
jgi:DNA-3-methyladenine glycosylase